MDALIGHTGFVGGNLARQHHFEACFNTANIETISGRAFDTLVFAGAQGKKWWANQNPEADREGIRRALNAMRDVRARRVVLISSIDVLPMPAGVDETFDCAAIANQAYGANRLWLEQEIRARHPGAIVVRLPGLFGPGLRKNIVYDLLHDNMVDKIDPAARFQFYDLSGLWDDILRAEAAGLKLIHFATEPVLTADIVDRFFPGAAVGAPPASGSLEYDVHTRHAAIFGAAGCYVQDRTEVMRRLGAFIAAERGDRA
ncbi:MAG: NAD(P)-dependent oxidoreductase [Acetobacteraceae bacterium]|nr:NAD(P)-dependent oxidoreductase [Acetobacteraceae bacterium]